MEHVLATLESKVSPEAMNTPAPEGLKTGHINAGMSLYGAYAKDETTVSTALETIFSLADTLTQDQFATACKDCQKVASNEDAAYGFVEVAGSKGQDKYGPRRRVINARMSEAKVLFGVQKMNPAILKEKGYWAAVSTARDYLDAKALKWDGNTKPTEQQREQQKTVRANDKAIKAAMEQMPRDPGQSLTDWLLNGGDDLAQAIQADQEFEESLQALQKIGPVAKMPELFFRYMKKFVEPTKMHILAQDLHEEAQRQIDGSIKDAPF